MQIVRRLTGLMARATPAKSASLLARRAVASITFDDFPQSAWRVAGPLLARYGARATYYAAGDLAGRTFDGIEYYDTSDLRELQQAGHEIGCHGYLHQPTPPRATRVLASDLERNARFLAPFLGGGRPDSYAYPYGAVSPRTKLFYARRFSNIRGVHPGINEGRLDLAQLRTVGLEIGGWNDAVIDSAISRARHSRGWIVFYTHDVSNTPSRHGCTPAMLESVLKRLAAADIDVLPMREALRVATGAAG